MYFPLSQITPNLYTNGNEFILKDSKKPYIGYYWKTSSGTYYTGKTPQNPPFEELIIKESSNNEEKLNSYYNRKDPNSLTYLNIKNESQPGELPTFSPNIPTQEDYNIGEYRRYFCKKTNEIIYLEISEDTYNKLTDKSTQINWQLFQPFNIPWKLTGNKEQVYNVNKNMVELTKMPMFNEYLRNNFTKYYQV